MQTLLVDFFNTAVSGVRVLKVIFFVRHKDVLRTKRLSDAHFHMRVFFIGNH